MDAGWKSWIFISDDTKPLESVLFLIKALHKSSVCTLLDRGESFVLSYIDEEEVSYFSFCAFTFGFSIFTFLLCHKSVAFLGWKIIYIEVEEAGKPYLFLDRKAGKKYEILKKSWIFEIKCL